MRAATWRAAVWLALAIPGLAGGMGCATLLTLEGDTYRHRDHDYTIARPEGPWQRIEVEGAVLAYQRSGPESMSLQSRCGRPVASPQLMARHLVIGLRDRKLVSAGPVGVSGRSGWTQTFDTFRAGAAVRVKTVTLVARDCTFDWVLASGDGFEDAERSFDAWWATFRLGPRYEQEEG